MSDLEPDHGKREIRKVTGALLLLALSAVVSSVSPAVEAFLDLWVPVAIGVAAGVVGAVLGIKRLWERWSH